MIRTDVRIAAFALCTALALVTACANVSTLPGTSPNATENAVRPGNPAKVNAIAPNTMAARIPLVHGMSIGVNTFPDGDTSSGGQGQKIDRLLPCHRMVPSGFHIHIHLSIFDPSGAQIMVPWGIGIVPPYKFNPEGTFINNGTCFYGLHVHDRSGVIHDEGKTDLGLTLGEFFDVWGMPLSTTNVAGYTGTVWVKIITPTGSTPWSDTMDPRTILLTEHEQITLAMDQPVKPLPIYKFTY